MLLLLLPLCNDDAESHVALCALSQDDGTGGNEAVEEGEEEREDDGEEEEEAEEEEEEEELADNTTMEQDEWWMHGNDENFDSEATSLSAPSDTSFIQLAKLLQSETYEAANAGDNWPSVLGEDRWGDEVDAAEVMGKDKVTSIDHAYKALDPPTVGEGGNEVTSRMTTSMLVPPGPWRNHLGIQDVSAPHFQPCLPRRPLSPSLLTSWCGG